MITNCFIPELNNHDVQGLWFQQDGATCHTARATINLLKDTFGDRLISRFGPVNWPPRSCDLTPLDYFLWGYVKSLVYADMPQTLDHLEDNIRRVIADIRRQMVGKVIENWTSRLDYIRANRGSSMPEMIFKMTRDFATHMTVRIGTYLSHCSCKAVANSWFLCKQDAISNKIPLKIKMDRLKLKLEIVEALSATPPTNKSILTDNEDNSVVIPLAKRSKRYNAPATYATAFILAISGYNA
ncbi:transposase [Trichonephila clavipes]|nr:transposase [Trichonephila clavipes]